MGVRLGTGYAYDSNGNTLTSVTGSNTSTYAWDFENRLTSVTLPGAGGTVSFKYDPFGRRIYKSSSSATSVYAYDGDNLVEETNATGTVVARYEQTQNIDEPLAMLRSSTTSYFHADGLGSVTSLSSAAGSIANTYTYDSFGKLTASTGSLVNPFQYTARESDTETGLYYYRARYYDPAPGRFISEDRIGFDGGVDFYAYVENAPTILIDPYGLDSSPWGPILNRLGPVFGGPRVPTPGVTSTLHCTIPSECNFQPEMQTALDCFQKTLSHPVTITCGNGRHDLDDPHMHGLAVDISLNANPWLTRGDAENAFAKCFPQGKGGSYAQQEYNSDNPANGTHIHIQFTPGQGVVSTFAPGIKPHGKPKPKSPPPCCGN
jgi:RHS repeat-associated protein